MSNRYETSVDLRAAPGVTYVLLAGLTHAVGLIAALTLPAYLTLFGLAGVGLSAWSARRAWFGPRRVVWGGYGSICLLGANGDRSYADSISAPFRSAWLVVLEVCRGGQRWRFPVFRWEQPEALRRLNQRLIAGRNLAAGPLDEARV